MDAVYGVHGDCKGQFGGSFTLEKGSIHTVSCKQKVNTKSSTKFELVAVDDCIGHAILLRHFLLAQVYKKAETILILQDNQSAILLEQNGISSSTKILLTLGKLRCNGALLTKWSQTTSLKPFVGKGSDILGRRSWI